MSNKNLKILYWTLTILFLLPTAGSAIPELFMSGPEQTIESLKRLGYPLYLMKILGLSKILGAAIILINKYSILKEWAYAGFSILFLGATASHILANDISVAPIPFIMFLIMISSYFIWHKLNN